MIAVANAKLFISLTVSLGIAIAYEGTVSNNRIETLDLLRGFALLGILLMNILSFGMVYHAYSSPGFDLTSAWS